MFNTDRELRAAIKLTLPVYIKEQDAVRAVGYGLCSGMLMAVIAALFKIYQGAAVPVFFALAIGAMTGYVGSTMGRTVTIKWRWRFAVMSSMAYLFYSTLTAYVATHGYTQTATSSYMGRGYRGPALEINYVGIIHPNDVLALIVAGYAGYYFGRRKLLRGSIIQKAIEIRNMTPQQET